jgi:hypothetical protein
MERVCKARIFFIFMSSFILIGLAEMASEWLQLYPEQLDICLDLYLHGTIDAIVN